MRSVTATNFRELVSNNEHRDETTKDTTWSRKQTATKISVIASELSGRISVSGGTSVGGKGIFNQNTVTQGTGRHVEYGGLCRGPQISIHDSVIHNAENYCLLVNASRDLPVWTG